MSRRANPRVKRTLNYWLRHQRQKCECIGYHFPHRKTGRACVHSPRADYYHALRSGSTVAEAMALLSVNQLERMFPL